MINKDLKLKIYDDEGNEVREASAKMIRIRFGTIRDLFKLLKIEDATSTAELFAVIYEVWDEIIRLLSQIFPDVTDEEWTNVAVDELIPLVIQIVKGAFQHMGEVIPDSEAVDEDAEIKN